MLRLVFMNKNKLFLFLFILIFNQINAQAPVSIKKIDASNYPKINLIVSSKEPRFTFNKNKTKRNTLFKVSEIFEKNEFVFENTKVEELNKNAKRLNLILVIDNTLSLQNQKFNDVINYTKKLLKLFGNNDKVSLIIAKDEPKTVLDLTSNIDKVLLEVSEIKHDGKVTRIYDSLYSALYTAKSVIENTPSEELAETKTVLLFITDGKEEASYINDNDCYELSGIGSKNSVPVHILIFDGSSKLSKVAGTAFRNLKRLTLKTNGNFTINPQVKDLNNTIDELKSLPEPIYKISYTTNKDLHNFPFLKVFVRISLGDTDFGSISNFRVPLLFYITHNNSIIWIIFGLILFIIIICWSVLKIFNVSETNNQKREVYKQKNNLDDDSKDKVNDNVEIRSEKDISKINANDIDKPKKTEAKDEDFLGNEEYWKDKEEKYTQKLKDKQIELNDEPPSQYAEGNMLMENERALYMREHSYRMLQLALKNAASYKRAGISTIIPSDYSNEPPKRRVYDLFLQNTLLGSGRWAHIPIRDNLASPIHARIKKIDKRYVIYDLMSGSGVYLNDNKILRPMGLKHGDSIRIGRVNFTFLGKN